MKGIKLQLGDYVFIKSLYGGYHTSLIKISAIHLKKVGYHNVLDRLNWVRFSLLEPILLTPEILEKNGFNKVLQPDCSNSYYWEFKEHEKETGELLYSIKAYCNSLRGMYVSIGSYGDIVSFGKQIEHFHEFQQVLRLCGLDKLVDNLKIEE